MVILGGWVFLMSEVPLYRAGFGFRVSGLGVRGLVPNPMSVAEIIALRQ